MRFLLLNQTFYPDVVATAQVLTDLAVELRKAGHEVTVVSSQRAYDKPGQRFASREEWKGIQIHRIGSTGFGKGAKWKRAVDFASFLAACSFKLLILPRHDVVIALTSPPLISFLGALVAKRHHSRFFYWIMDLNPDEAIAAGWLKEQSFVARFLEKISRFSLRQSEKIIVLDRFMEDRILAKGIPREKIAVIPPWSHDEDVRFDQAGRDAFRKKHGLENKFVVMYSGNHSPCHPLDTLLEAARRLVESRGARDEGSEDAGCSPEDLVRDAVEHIPTTRVGGSPKDPALDPRPSTLDSSLVFCFVGGGSEWRKIQNSEFKNQNSTNILCLPYQPLNELAGSLSAADLHVVVMGEPFLGTIHPCKIYNILLVGSPVLYVGPTPSHITEILEKVDERSYGLARHGEVEKVMKHIARLRREQKSERDVQQFDAVAAKFSKRTLLPKMLALFDKRS